MASASSKETSQHPIDRAQAELEKRPVMAADQALSALGGTRGHRSSEETAEYLDVLALAVIRASGCPVPETDEDPVEAMLGDRKCDRLACAALLRLLVFDDEAFSEDRRMLGAASLFDRVLAKTLYPEAGLTTKAQSFLKRDRLRTLVADHEEALIELVKSLGSIEGMDAFRPSFGKLFNSKVNYAVVLPFLPTGVTRQTFDELLSGSQAVFECSDASLVDDAEEITGRCRRLTESSDELGTWYAEALVSRFTETLESLVRRHVSDAGFSDPAELELALRPKTYPLWQAGSPVIVRMDLSNLGPGQAQEVTVEIVGGGLIEYEDTVRSIGLMAPGRRLVEFHGTVGPATIEHGVPLSDELMVTIRWRNADGSKKEEDDVVALGGQEAELPWEKLTMSSPYSLSPVETRDEFAGQEAAVRDLSRVILQGESARIQGEKRVGKTSLANAVRGTVRELTEAELDFIMLESGDFNAHSAEATVARLGELISDAVRRSDRRLANLPAPSFAEGLSTLTELFAAADEAAPDRRFVIVLDEFDEMPHSALYRHEPVGESFFLTLRSLGGKPNVSFVLIGGGRMKWVISVHGQVLNKFKVVPLEYFGKDQLADYGELVRAPVEGILSFSEQAVELLHTETAGNPWVTKLLLRQLYERQVERRDMDVQVDDVGEAIVEALPKIGPETFQHFWDDAIRGDAEEQEHVSTLRRRVLLALGRCLEAREEASEEAVIRVAREFRVDEPTATDVLRDLQERLILHRNPEGVLRCRLPLFERWLPEYGPREIVLGSGDDDAILARQRAEDALRPTIAELGEIAKRWRSYKGEDMHAEQIGDWLKQFGGPKEQRAMMPVLEGLRFYTRSTIAVRLRDLNDYVNRELAERGHEFTLSGRQRLRSDLLVCPLEGGGSGAGQLLKPYREENGIYRNCVVETSEVPGAIGREEIRAVLILEDMIGTGGTAVSNLRALHSEWTAGGPWPADVDVFLLAICGFEEGIERVEEAAAELEWPVTIKVADVLDERDRCLSEGSAMFESEEARTLARALCAEHGTKLSPKFPFGFEDGEAALCFEYRCPNNSLPVLWKDSEDWTALFPRL